MTAIAYFISGLVIGGALVWIIASSRLKSFYIKQIADVQMEHAIRLAELEARAKGPGL